MTAIGNAIGTVWNGLTATCGRLVGSRKMLLALISIGISFATLLSPELGPRAQAIGFYTFLVVVVLGGGFLVEGGDIVKAFRVWVDAWAERPTTLADGLSGLSDAQKQVALTPAKTSAPAPDPLPPEVVAKGLM